jgi:putative acetyltransferase
MLTQVQIRPIELTDNKAIAQVIRTTLEEFGANKPGTVYFDESTDHLYELFQAPGAIYHIALLNGEVVGGGGIYPTPGLPTDTCELVKMYILKKVRGIGLGRMLIQKSLEYAKEAGYKKVYLETMPELKQALATYQKFGFQYINQPMGNSGHFGCDLWMLKEL